MALLQADFRKLSTSVKANGGSPGRGLLDRRETRWRVTLVVRLCGGRRYRSEVAIGRQAIQKYENLVRV